MSCSNNKDVSILWPVHRYESCWSGLALCFFVIDVMDRLLLGGRIVHQKSLGLITSMYTFLSAAKIIFYRLGAWSRVLKGSYIMV